jgi:soluble lytic murein transglycosylase-like protein
MQRRLQITLTASLTAISFLSTMFSTVPAHAQSGSRSGGITSSTDQSGRKIYVNEDGPSSGASKGEASTRSRSPLVYWSVTEHRFKPVPTSGAVMRAARSAASEVNTYLDGRGQSHQTLNRAFTAQDIDAAIDQAAARHNVDPSLVRSVVKVESNFNPNAVSRKGAMGLMQLMPATARQYGVKDPYDPASNIEGGVKYLKTLLERLPRDLALAAYNAGEAAVERFHGIPPYAETRNYVSQIVQLLGR